MVVAATPPAIAFDYDTCRETGMWGGLEDFVPNTPYNASKGTRSIAANTVHNFDGCGGPNAVTQFMSLNAQTWGTDYIETGIYEIARPNQTFEKVFVEWRVFPAPYVFQLENTVPSTASEWLRLKLESPSQSTNWTASVSWGDGPASWIALETVSGLNAGSGWPVAESSLYSVAGDADAFMYQRKLETKNGHGLWGYWWSGFCFIDTLVNWEPGWYFTPTRAETAAESGNGACVDTPPGFNPL